MSTNHAPLLYFLLWMAFSWVLLALWLGWKVVEGA